MREANEMETNRAGPSAVCPPSSNLQSHVHSSYIATSQQATPTTNSNHATHSHQTLCCDHTSYKTDHVLNNVTNVVYMHACACVCAYSKIFLLRVLLVFSTGAGRAMSSPAFMIDSKLFSLSPANVTTSPCPSPTTFTCTHAHTHTYTHHQTSQTPSTNVTEYRNIGHNVCGVVRVNIWKDQFTSKMY